MAAKKKAEEEKSVKNQKDGAPLSRAERAAALMDEVNKKMRGRAILKPASEYVLPWSTKRVPTGLLTLDIELRGGFPCGGISQIIGRRNAGKTLLAWQCVRQLQHFIGDNLMVLLAMTEIPADRSQARKVGVQIHLGDDELYALNEGRMMKGEKPLTRKEADELFPQIGTIHELHAMAAEDFYDVILRAVEQNTYHLIIIDSIGNALANAEQENESVHDKTYGGTSAPNTMFLKKLTNMLTMETDWGDVRDTCIIGINQVRDNIKDPNAPYKAPGGNALEHAKLVDLYVESGTMLGNDQAVYTPAGWKQQFIPYGKEVNWKIVKGKAGMHEGGKGKFVFLYDTSNFDFFLDTLVAGVTHGVIEQSGAWLGVRDPFDDSKYLVRAQGKDAFIKALKDDVIEKSKAGDGNTYMNYIREACFRKVGIDIKYNNWK
jgi:RecA/RadA recombinase